MPASEVPDIVIGRLPIYLRALDYMAQEGREIISSRELASYLGISSAQIRKDLSHFGGFGKQGTGYHVQYLREQLIRILNIDREWPVALVGVGHLGSALANYQGFLHRGFRIAAIFDSSPSKIGTVVGGLEVLPVERLGETLRATGIKIAMIAVPASAAQEVADMLIEAGVRGILNYAPITLSVPDGVHVQYIDPAAHLQHMTYYLGRNGR